MLDKPKRKSHWSLPWTADREKKIERLRERLSTLRSDGERIHGTLTTTQLLDWALNALLVEMEHEDERQFVKQWDTSATDK